MPHNPLNLETKSDVTHRRLLSLFKDQNNDLEHWLDWLHNEYRVKHFHLNCGCFSTGNWSLINQERTWVDSIWYLRHIAGSTINYDKYLEMTYIDFSTFIRTITKRNQWRHQNQKNQNHLQLNKIFIRMTQSILF